MIIAPENNLFIESIPYEALDDLKPNPFGSLLFELISRAKLESVDSSSLCHSELSSEESSPVDNEYPGRSFS